MKVILVTPSAGDWIALYRDGLLVTEGHSLSERATLEAAHIEVESIEVSDDYAEGGLPEGLTFLPTREIIHRW